MADQQPGGIVLDEKAGKLGVSDQAVKEVRGLIEHVVDRGADLFDHHPITCDIALGLLVLGIIFQRLRARDKVTLNRELKPRRHAPASPAREKNQPRIQSPDASHHLPQGHQDGP